MLIKITKFVLLTRYSKQILAFFTLLLAYDFSLGYLAKLKPIPGFSTYAVLAVSAFAVTSIALGGLVILSSDRDYLFTLPASKTELAVALFISQFFSIGVSLLMFLGFYVPVLRQPVAVSVSYVVVLALYVTSLSVSFSRLGWKTRASAAVLMGAWLASPLGGFRYSPTSFLTGEFRTGYLLATAAACCFLAVAYREFSNITLEHMRSVTRNSSQDYSKIRSFTGLSPLRALLYRNLFTIELSGRVNMGSGLSYRSARIDTRKAILISAVAGVAYYVAVRTFQPPMQTLALTIMALFWVGFGMLLAQATLSNERCWLAFASAEPAWYIRRLVASKILSLEALSSPFVAAAVALALSGVHAAASAALILSLVSPSTYLLFVFISGRLGPVQSREEAVSPGQFNVRQLLVVASFYVVIGVTASSIAYTPLAELVAACSAVLALAVFSASSLWRRLAFSLPAKGFS